MPPNFIDMKLLKACKAHYIIEYKFNQLKNGNEILTCSILKIILKIWSVKSILFIIKFQVSNLKI